MNFLKIYRNVKNVFIKPKLKLYFGTWKNEPNLPVWRRGPQIKLGKYSNMYIPRNSVLYFSGYSKNGYRTYSRSNHKLPVKPYTYVWERNIRKKLKKWHLSWIPPIIQLPISLSFNFMDRDVYWKTKYDEYRYEYPAHITLVFFGLAISITAYAPQLNGGTSDDDYWESILTYSDCKNLEKTDEELGRWRTEDDKYTIRFNPEFLKEPYKQQLKDIQKEKYHE